MQITKNFTLEEFEKSNIAEEMRIDNRVVTATIRQNIVFLVRNILQPLRDAWGKPLRINSGYRCPELNSLVGGHPESKHTKGQAADIACDNPYELACLVKKLNLPFNKMGLYKNFVHISYLPASKSRIIFYDKSYNGKRF